jgi:hypothetical protein
VVADAGYGTEVLKFSPWRDYAELEICVTPSGTALDDRVEGRQILTVDDVSKPLDRDR